MNEGSYSDQMIDEGLKLEQEVEVGEDFPTFDDFEVFGTKLEHEVELEIDDETKENIQRGIYNSSVEAEYIDGLLCINEKGCSGQMLQEELGQTVEEVFVVEGFKVCDDKLEGELEKDCISFEKYTKTDDMGEQLQSCAIIGFGAENEKQTMADSSWNIDQPDLVSLYNFGLNVCDLVGAEHEVFKSVVDFCKWCKSGFVLGYFDLVPGYFKGVFGKNIMCCGVKKCHNEMSRLEFDPGGERCKNWKLHLNVYPDKEKAAFLRSLGWDGNAGEDDGLTEVENNAFYEEYENTKPLLKLCKEVEQKVASLCGSHTTGSSGASSELSLNSGVFWETERKNKLKAEVLCYIDSSSFRKCNKNASCYSDIDLVAKNLKGNDIIVSEMGLGSGKFVLSIYLHFSGNSMMHIHEKRSFNRSSLSYSNISLVKKNLKGTKVVVLLISREGSKSCLYLMVVLVSEWFEFVLEQFWEDKNEQSVLFQFPFDPGGYEHPIDMWVPYN